MFLLHHAPLVALMVEGLVGEGGKWLGWCVLHTPNTPARCIGEHKKHR